MHLRFGLLGGLFGIFKVVLSLFEDQFLYVNNFSNFNILDHDFLKDFPYAVEQYWDSTLSNKFFMVNDF